MPAGLLPFKVWNDNFSNNVNIEVGNYGITAPIDVIVQAKTVAFNAALTISTNPIQRTPVTVADTQLAFDDLRTYVQGLVQIMQATGTITGPVAAQFGITFRDTTKTQIPPPIEIPELALQSSTPQAAKMRVKELGSLSNRIPFGAVGYQVAMSVAPVVPPTSPTQLSIIGNGTKRFYDLSFDPAAIGDTFYVSVRYINARQEPGPWSNIVTSTVLGG